MTQILSHALASGQPVYITPNGVAEAKAIGAEIGAAEIMTRTYHLGLEATPGRGYDDRLTMRTGYGLTRLRELLALPIHRGGLRHNRNGRNYVVTERAVQEFFAEYQPAKAAA